MGDGEAVTIPMQAMDAGWLGKLGASPRIRYYQRSSSLTTSCSNEKAMAQGEVTASHLCYLLL